MQPIDSESPEQAIPEAIIGEKQQTSTQAKGLLRTFIAFLHPFLTFDCRYGFLAGYNGRILQNETERENQCLIHMQKRPS
jgi:hypothetical protein